MSNSHTSASNVAVATEKVGVDSVLAAMMKQLADMQATNVKLVSTIETMNKKSSTVGGGKSTTTIKRKATNYNLFLKDLRKQLKTDHALADRFQTEYPPSVTRKDGVLIQDPGSIMQFCSKLWDNGKSDMALSFLNDDGGRLSALRSSDSSESTDAAVASSSSASNSSASSATKSSDSSSTGSSNRSDGIDKSRHTKLRKWLSEHEIETAETETLTELLARQTKYRSDLKAKEDAKRAETAAAAETARNAIKTAAKKAVDDRKAAAALLKAEKDRVKAYNRVAALGFDPRGQDLEQLQVIVKANAGKREVKENLRKVPYLPEPTAETVAVAASASTAAPMPIRPRHVELNSSSSSNSASAAATEEYVPDFEPDVEDETEEGETDEVVIDGVVYQVDAENRAYDVGEFMGWVYAKPDGDLFLSQKDPKSATGGGV